MNANLKNVKQMTLSDNQKLIVIGKDILELLSSAMYVNPLTIFREYIQNSIDSIEEATELKIVQKKDGAINILIDSEERSITITDNGVGVKSKEFLRRMTSIGASKKRGTDARGFRGVGRLSGLGYCRELVFRTKAAGESKISEVRWDCERLKKILRDNSSHEGLKTVISETTSFSSTSSSDKKLHFFEVKLYGAVRFKKDVLLNNTEIVNYVSQVGPVPFSPQFEWGKKINSVLESIGGLTEVKIYMNDSKVPLYRPHTNEIIITENLRNEYTDLEEIEIATIDGDTAAKGWVLHQNYSGALPKSAGIRGLRARVGNIQVGQENIFEEIFNQTRFNSWSIGEIHIVDKKIIPNGRRDNFDQTAHFSNLVNQLVPLGRNIAAKCHQFSLIRSKLKRFETKRSNIKEKLRLINFERMSKKEINRIKDIIIDDLNEMEWLVSNGNFEKKIKTNLSKNITRLKTTVEKTLKDKVSKDGSAELDFLSTSKRNVYQDIFGMIYEYSNNVDVAERLIKKIIRRARKEHGQL